MTDNDDDEFKDIVKGLPSENTGQRSSIKLILSFGLAAIVLAVVVLALGSAVSEMLEGFSYSGNYIPQQILLNGLLSTLLGSLQAWIFRAKIKRRSTFITFSVIGGIVGGFIAGLAINSTSEQPALIGVLNGSIAAGISSLAQNRQMGNRKYGMRWFFYNVVSWSIIFAATWALAWKSENFALLAIAGAFIVVASGVGLVIFLRRSPQIEFS